MAFVNISYTPYGYAFLEGNDALLGFKGALLDNVSGHYLLGNGYRGFRSELMRFCGPDSWSPFGSGGLNAYAYCADDPVNLVDPTGHMPFKGLFEKLKKAVRTKDRTGAGKYAREGVADFTVNRAQRPVFVGFHGTSDTGAKGILRSGVVSHSKSDSFFVTNTISSANQYAGSHGQGAVLKVYTENYAQLQSVSTRSVVKQSNIPQLKIPKVAHADLRFEVVLEEDLSSNFNRFMTEQESTVYWISKFRQQ